MVWSGKVGDQLFVPAPNRQLLKVLHRYHQRGELLRFLEQPYHQDIVGESSYRNLSSLLTLWSLGQPSREFYLEGFFMAQVAGFTVSQKGWFLKQMHLNSRD